MSLPGHSVTFSIGNNATHQTSTTWQPVAEVLEITPPKSNVDKVETSHMLSPEQYKTYTAGWTEVDDVEVKIGFNADQSDTIYGLLKQDKGFKITFVDGSEWRFSGFVNSFGDEAELEV